MYYGYFVIYNFQHNPSNPGIATALAGIADHVADVMDTITGDVFGELVPVEMFRIR